MKLSRKKAKFIFIPISIVALLGVCSSSFVFCMSCASNHQPQPELSHDFSIPESSLPASTIYNFDNITYKNIPQDEQLKVMYKFDDMSDPIPSGFMGEYIPQSNSTWLTIPDIQASEFPEKHIITETFYLDSPEGNFKEISVISKEILIKNQNPTDVVVKVKENIEGYTGEIQTIATIETSWENKQKMSAKLIDTDGNELKDWNPSLSELKNEFKISFPIAKQTVVGASIVILWDNTIELARSCKFDMESYGEKPPAPQPELSHDFSIPESSLPASTIYNFDNITYKNIPQDEQLKVMYKFDDMSDPIPSGFMGEYIPQSNSTWLTIPNIQASEFPEKHIITETFYLDSPEGNFKEISVISKEILIKNQNPTDVVVKVKENIEGYTGEIQTIATIETSWENKQKMSAKLIDTDGNELKDWNPSLSELKNEFKISFPIAKQTVVGASIVILWDNTIELARSCKFDMKARGEKPPKIEINLTGNNTGFYKEQKTIANINIDSINNLPIKLLIKLLDKNNEELLDWIPKTIDDKKLDITFPYIQPITVDAQIVVFWDGDEIKRTETFALSSSAVSDASISTLMRAFTFTKKPTENTKIATLNLPQNVDNKKILIKGTPATPKYLDEINKWEFTYDISNNSIFTMPPEEKEVSEISFKIDVYYCDQKILESKEINCLLYLKQFHFDFDPSKSVSCYNGKFEKNAGSVETDFESTENISLSLDTKSDIVANKWQLSFLYDNAKINSGGTHLIFSATAPAVGTEDHVIENPSFNINYFDSVLHTTVPYEGLTYTNLSVPVSLTDVLTDQIKHVNDIRILQLTITIKSKLPKIHLGYKFFNKAGTPLAGIKAHIDDCSTGTVFTYNLWVDRITAQGSYTRDVVVSFYIGDESIYKSDLITYTFL